MTSEQCTHATWCTGERDHEYDCSVATQLADLTAERDALRARAEAAENLEADRKVELFEVIEDRAKLRRERDELRVEVERLRDGIDEIVRWLESDTESKGAYAKTSAATELRALLVDQRSAQAQVEEEKDR
jgi:uncharacterized coiled-coil DUF342 family protein